MQGREESPDDVAKEIAAVTQILKSVANETDGRVCSEITKATEMLTRLVAPGRNLPFQMPESCPAVDLLLGSDRVVTQQLPFADFVNVEVDCAFVFEISASSAYSVAITTNENVFPYVDVVKSGNTLRLTLKAGRFEHRPVLEARIKMPALHKLRQAAATKGIVGGFNSDGPFDLYLSGASALHMDMTVGDAKIEVSGASRAGGTLRARNVDCVLSGASRAELRGSAASLILSAWGATAVDLTELVARRATVYLKGASRATVNVSGQLDIDLSGASRLNYIGRPELFEISLSGASTLNQTGVDS
jgi:hypothetical protein